ncbi:hypothetical protein LTR17_008742 [Elasticomyces elasticus]|nr:hypothetical protein LTR17_008742 [Elasticomyces elasticus]
MADGSGHEESCSSQTKGRSATGCWTCRVRRKKCDERPERCKTCSSLRLKCDGYGTRPLWMDGGIREKQKVEDLKRRVRRHRKRSQTLVKRPRGVQESIPPQQIFGDRIGNPTISVLGNASGGDRYDWELLSAADGNFLPWTEPFSLEAVNNTPRVDEMTVDTSLQALVDFNKQLTIQSSSCIEAQSRVNIDGNISSPSALCRTDARVDNLSFEQLNGHQRSRDQQTAYIPGEHDVLDNRLHHMPLDASTDDTFSEQWMSLLPNRDQRTAGDLTTLDVVDGQSHTLPPGAIVEAAFSEQWTTLLQDEQTTNNPEAFNVFDHDTHDLSPAAAFSPSAESFSFSPYLSTVHENSGHDENCGRPPTPADSTEDTHSGTSDARLTVTSPDKHTRSGASSKGPREISATSTDEKSSTLWFFTHSVLPNQFPHAGDELLSQLRHLILSPQEPIKEYVRITVAEYVDCLTSRGLEKFGLRTSSDRGAKIGKDDIESIYMLLSTDALTSDTEVRNRCVEEITVMLVHQTLFQIDECPTTKVILGNVAKLVTDDHKRLGSRSLLVELFQSLLSSLEIIGSATFGMPLQTCTSPGGTTLSASLSQVTGCQTWVFHNILEITNFRMWKLSAVETGSLNVVELANKASAIRRDIEHQRSNIEQKDVGVDSAVLQITEAFAHAAEIYLHTTASGAYPNVSDIRHSVSRVVVAIKRLSRPQLLESLAWPICVTASMATEEHESFFSGIANGARRNGDYSVKLTRALCVAKECQRLRKTNIGANVSEERRAYDWFDAMRSLGKEWNLL